MASKSKIKDKHLRLDQTKIDRVKKLLGTKTDTETVEKALEILLIEESLNKAHSAVAGQADIEKVFA